MTRVSPKLRAHLTRIHAGNKKPEAARNRILRNYKLNAKYRGLVFDVPPQEFDRLIASNCFYCGDPPSNVVTGYALRYSGIDRVQNECGYIAGNCVACCRVCNDMKGTLSYHEFLERVRRVYMAKIYLDANGTKVVG